MAYKVMIEFSDKNDPKRIFKRGSLLEVYDLERANDLQVRGLVEKVETKEPAEDLDAKPAEETKEPAKDLDTEPVEETKEPAKDLDTEPAEGKKAPPKAKKETR